MKKLGDAISKVVTPIASRMGSDCIDPVTNELKPESTCAKVRDDLNEGRYRDAIYDRFFNRSRNKNKPKE